jgi:hypothetical protein
VFIRRKKNRSGGISIVIIAKGNGKFREVKTTGTSFEYFRVGKIVCGRQLVDFLNTWRAEAAVA